MAFFSLAVLGSLSWIAPGPRTGLPSATPASRIPPQALRLRHACWEQARSSVVAVVDEDAPPVKKLLGDLQFLGPLRFIVQGGAGILEAVAEVEKVQYAEVGGGEMATLKTDEGDFEAHLRLNQLTGVQMETKQKGDKDLHIIRFLAGDVPGAPREAEH
mmetsp:Transcript_26988/g.72769  ORF Transcript_26988/g.72769 Transcript_26988/m.72769 type:complete len:159 (-) Transcript_26988:128-604(-)